MYSEELYISYFEDLAIRLIDLGHTQQAPHFFMNHETGNGLKELDMAIGGKLKMPVLVLDEQELHSDGSSMGQKQNISGGFAILDKFEPGNMNDLRRVRIKTQQIARKLINKMKRDSRASFDEESPLLLAHAIQVGEIQQYGTPIILNQLAGWAVEFTWLTADDISFGINDFE